MKLGDIDLYFEEKGQGEPLLLIAGFAKNATVWDPVFEKLAKNFRVIRFDNRGIGRTTASPGPYTMQQMANDTALLLDHLGLESVNAIGHSMGGCILQQLCIDHPKRVKKAVIYSSLAKVPKTGALAMQLSMEIAGLDMLLCHKMAVVWAFGSTYLENEENYQKEIDLQVNNPYPVEVDGILGQHAAIFSFDSRDSLQKIACPTLVIAGNEDISTPLFCEEQIANGIPNAKLHVENGIGHSFHIENPNSFINVINSFYS